MFVFVDLETGTVLNGPMVALSPDVDLEGLSDSEIIEIAREQGQALAPIA